MKNLEKIYKPIIIIGCPRSGTTLLFTLLNSSPEIYSLYEESRFLFREFYLRKEHEGKFFADDGLRGSDLSAQEKASLVEGFHNSSYKSRLLGRLINKGLRKYSFTRPLASLLSRINGAFKNNPYRLVEKTPRNCFRVELMSELFPDAYFVFIKRDPRANISSLIEGWRKRKKEEFDEVKRLPRINRELNFSNFDGKIWRFAMPPDWQDYADKTLEEVCAYQWLKSNQEAVSGLAAIPDSRKMIISYEDLVADTPAIVQKICSFAEIKYTKQLKKLVEKPPAVNYLDGKPRHDKWKKNAKEIEAIKPMIESFSLELGYSCLVE